MNKDSVPFGPSPRAAPSARTKLACEQR
jgi:hypothetical protein